MRKRSIKYLFALLASLMILSLGTLLSVSAASPHSDKVSVDAEALTKPDIVSPGKTAAAKTYVFDKGKQLFVLPIEVGANPDVHLDVMLSGVSSDTTMLISGNPSFDKVVDWVAAYYAGDKSMADKFILPGYASSKKESILLDKTMGKTQYLFILKNQEDYDKTLTVKVNIFQYKTTKNKSVTTLRANKWKSAYNAKGTLYYKVKVNSSGILKVEYDSADAAKVTLLNSKKKTLGKTYALRERRASSVFYSVKKGTYYLKLQTTGDVKIRYALTKVTDSKNTAQSKALTLKKGKSSRVILTSGTSSKSYKWYKIKVTKTQNVELSIQNTGSDTVRAALFKKGSKKVLASEKIYEGETENVYHVNSIDMVGTMPSTVRLKAGTYYLRISKGTKAESVSAVLKWE